MDIRDENASAIKTALSRRLDRGGALCTQSGRMMTLMDCLFLHLIVACVEDAFTTLEPGRAGDDYLRVRVRVNDRSNT